jgi:hypothetical protein
MKVGVCEYTNGYRKPKPMLQSRLRFISMRALLPTHIWAGHAPIFGVFWKFVTRWPALGFTRIAHRPQGVRTHAAARESAYLSFVGHRRKSHSKRSKLSTQQKVSTAKYSESLFMRVEVGTLARIDDVLERFEDRSHMLREAPG